MKVYLANKIAQTKSSFNNRKFMLQTIFAEYHVMKQQIGSILQNKVAHKIDA